MASSQHRTIEDAEGGPSRLATQDNGGSFEDTQDLNSPKPLDEISDEEDIIILVAGPTGTGKSTFICNATGDSSAKVGHSLESETKEVKTFHTNLRGRRITLVDTPGFDDTQIPNADIFNSLAQWLAESYRANQKIAGILYLQRITDTRLSQAGKLSISMLKDICGLGFMKNVMLVSTLWDSDGEEREKQEERENQLVNGEVYWKHMITNGATTGRYSRYGSKELDRSRGAAHDLISMIIDKTPQATKLQEEMVKEGKDAYDTQAGRTLESKYYELIGEYKRLAEELEIAKKRASSNEERLQELDERQRVLKVVITHAEHEIKKLRGEYTRGGIRGLYAAVADFLSFFRTGSGAERGRSRSVSAERSL